MNTQHDEMADETITWIRAGRLYYRHESGLCFSAKMVELADANEEDEPYPVHLLGGTPADVTPYTPDESSPEGRVVQDWIDHMDSVAEAIGRVAVGAVQARLVMSALQNHVKTAA